MGNLKENFVLAVAIIAIATSIVAISTPGIQGATGLQGSQGVTGSQGPQGIQGAQGAPGPQGPTGAVGLTGPAGARGVEGETGEEGGEASNVPSLLPLGTISRGAAFTLYGAGFERDPKIEFMDSAGAWYKLGTAQTYAAGLIREPLVIPATAIAGTGCITATSRGCPMVSLAVIIN